MSQVGLEDVIMVIPGHTRLLFMTDCMVFKLSSKSIFTDRSKAVLLLRIIFCYLCFVFVMLYCLFIAAMWSPAGKMLTAWLCYM